jgi:hypothetical protein
MPVKDPSNSDQVSGQQNWAGDEQTALTLPVAAVVVAGSHCTPVPHQRMMV